MILAVLGMTYIITKSWLFEGIRENRLVTKHEWSYVLLRCPQCMSFWCAIVLCCILQTSVSECIEMALSSSGLAYLIERIFERDEI